MTIPERKRDFFDSAYLQLWLESSGTRLIYIDEFHVSLHTDSAYNWSLRNHPAVLISNLDPWTMSFIVALSSSGIEGILASTTSINSQNFTVFIYDLWCNLHKEEEAIYNPLLVFDNSKIHSIKISTKFIEKHSIKWLTIPPYSPQLNPAEKIIGMIKSKIRSASTKNKQLSLSLVKQIVDDTTEETWMKWILSSRMEVYKTMKFFKT